MKAQLHERHDDWTLFETALFNALTLDEYRVGALILTKRLEIAQKMIDAMEQALLSVTVQDIAGFCTAPTTPHRGAQG